MIAGLGSGGLMVGRTTPTLAAWTDPVVVSGNALTAYTVPKPAVSSCVVTGFVGFTATITWPAVTSPYAFNYSAKISETSAPVTVTTAGANRQVAVSSSSVGGGFGGTVHVLIWASLPSTPAWVSVSASQTLTVGFGGSSMSCGALT